MIPNISFVILSHNEGKYLNYAFTLLDIPYVTDIVIVDDYSDDIETIEILDRLNESTKVLLHKKRLDNDFGNQRNYANWQAKGDYVFHLDADETLTDDLVRILPSLVSNNPDIDLFWFPRTNTVTGLTPAHIAKWRWNVDEQGRVNWPDWQGRLHKRLPHIQWANKVHEVVTGHKTFTHLPADSRLAINHHKELDRQEQQNAYYETLG